MTVSLAWQPAAQGAELAERLRASQGSAGQAHDLVILCSGQTLFAHRSVLAAASPLLRVLLLEEESRGDEVQELCCPELEPKQAFQLLQFIYQGQVEGLDVSAAEDLVRAVGHLQITGLLPGRATLEPSSASLDDDVFTGPDVYIGPNNEEDVAVDLSPVTRQPPAPFNTLFSRNTNLGLGKGSPSATRNSSGGSQEEILQRIKKPKPLTMPHLGEPPVYLKPGSPIYLKPKTPRTPLLASPDCHVLEERFRHLIEGRDSDSDKLRNLSVSSADFNYDPNNGGGSVPGTPGSGLRSRSFNFPDRSLINPDSSLDLSIRRTSPPTLSIPTIHVNHVKPEPLDIVEQNSEPSSDHTYQQSRDENRPIKVERVEEGASFLLPVGAILEPIDQHPQADPLYQTMMPQKHGGNQKFSHLLPNTPSMEVQDKSSTPISNPPSTPKKKSSNGRKRNEPALNPPGERQSFKCQKCGKCYNWNYNLNRHIKFECGIENRFECSLCHKRFPYKQNAAIHLKRKHKIGLEAPGEKAPTPGVLADLMIGAGQITLLPVTIEQSSSLPASSGSQPGSSSVTEYTSPATGSS